VVEKEELLSVHLEDVQMKHGLSTEWKGLVGSVVRAMVRDEAQVREMAEQCEDGDGMKMKY
jgi:hypothetical protein